MLKFARLTQFILQLYLQDPEALDDSVNLLPMSDLTLVSEIWARLFWPENPRHHNMELNVRKTTSCLFVLLLIGGCNSHGPLFEIKVATIPGNQLPLLT